MENQEMMTLDVVEVAEDVTMGSSKGLKVAGGGLLLAGLAFGGYKLFKHLKAKKNSKYADLPKDEVVDEDEVE